MLSPNAEQIETATDQLKSGTALPPWLRQSQLKELHVARGDQSTDFALGYELGLQTARVAIAQNVAIAVAGIKASDVL